MMESNRKLDGLFEAYRGSVAVPEPGAHFMPELWARIEGRRSFAVRLTRMTQVFAGSAAVLCLVFTGLLVVPRASSTHAGETYVDVLADAHPTENLLAQGIAPHIDAKEAKR